MHLIRTVFAALRTFDRAATVRELQRESGLDRDELHMGLRGLDRRHLIVKDAVPRRAGVYRLIPDAELPQDLRGRFERDDEYRAKLRRTRLDFCAARVATSHVGRSPSGGFASGYVADDRTAAPNYRAAVAPNTAHAPGALRLVVKGVLDLHHPPHGPAWPVCALDDFWKAR